MENHVEMTYTEKEKEMLQKIREFAILLEEKLKEENNHEYIKQINYYEKYQVGNVELQDVYVSIIQNKDLVNKYQIYLKDIDNMIVEMDENQQKIYIDEKLKKLVDEKKINPEILEILNEDNLKVKTEALSKEEVQKELENKKDKENQQKEETKKVEEDLKQNLKEEKDLEISYYNKFIDNRLREEFPEIMNGSKEMGIAYSKALNSYICVVKTEKGYEMAPGTTFSKPMRENVISVDERGEKVEKKRPLAVIKTSDANKEIAINLDEHGNVRTEKVKVTRSHERISRKIDALGETRKVDKDVKETLDQYRTGTEEIEQMTQNFSKNQNDGDKKQTIEDLKRNEDWVIQMEDGTVIDMEKEAKKAKISTEEFIRRYEDAEGKDAKEKVEEVHQEIEDEFLRRDREKRN